jgi:protein-tyrosine-phosphatase
VSNPQSDVIDHHGSCSCGRYHFTARGNPRFVAYCHCNACRRSLGAPIACYVGYPSGQVVFDCEGDLTGVPAFESSPGVHRGFCDECGTALYYASEQWSGETHLFRSNFEQPETFAPTGHVFFAERETDVEIYDDLPRYHGSRAAVAWGPKPAFRILYLCTGNSARSILAEVITNLRAAELGGHRIRAHSAGSTPVGTVHPSAMTLIEETLYLQGVVRSKSWDEFTGTHAPDINLVVTLCDQAAGESCPAFPGNPQRLHWSLSDPAAGDATFEETYEQLEGYIGALLDELSSQNDQLPVSRLPAG